MYTAHITKVENGGWIMIIKKDSRETVVCEHFFRRKAAARKFAKYFKAIPWNYI